MLLVIGQQSLIGEDCLLQFASAQATDDGESEEAQAENQQQAEEGPLELLAEDERPKDLIDLVLGPHGLAPNET